MPTAAWVAASITLPGPEIEPLQRTVRDQGVYIAGMAYEKMPQFPGRYFNTAFIIDPRGEIALRYRKLYSITGKTTPLDVYNDYCQLFGGPESLFPVLDTPFGRLGVLVCYDIHFPEVARCLAMANSGPNIDSDLPPMVCHGGSQILDFHARTLNRTTGTEECLITAPIDIEALRRRRSGMRFNFLTELCPQAHAPIYAATQAWPLNAFAAAPMPDVAQNSALQASVLVEMRARGQLVAPDCQT